MIQKPILTGILCFLSLAFIVPAAWAEESQIRFGYFPNITHGQALYARAGGDFEKKTGAKIQWIAFNAGPSAIEALFTKAVDVTYIGPGPAINGFVKSEGESFVIVAGAASGGSGLIVRGDSGINTEKDFGGKTIATPQLGNTQDLAAKTWFMKKGYKLKEKGGNLTLIAIANPDQLTMFQKKEIDGAWTVEPWISRLEVEAGGRLFLDERTLWPEGKYATTLLVVSKAFLSKNPELVKRLLAAHVEATQALNGDRARIQSVLNQQLKKETGKALSEEVIQKALKRVEFTWEPMRNSLQKNAESSHKLGFLRKLPDLTHLYSLDLLNQVLKEKGLPPVSEK